MSKLHAPAALRNREPILDVLDRHLPRECRVLEIASGSGEHAVFFCERRPGWQWTPSDPSVRARASIEAFREEAGCSGLLAPLDLDMLGPAGAAPAVDAVVCINMIHISPWAATRGLMRTASACLAEGGVLVTYGPYCFDGSFLAESNRAFDQSLRSRNPEWGVRDADAVAKVAYDFGLQQVECVALPANNHALVFRRALQPVDDASVS